MKFFCDCTTNPDLARRRWLKSTATLGAGFMILPRSLVFGSRANDAIHVACVGVANIGAVNRLWLRDGQPPPKDQRLRLPDRKPGTRIVALCDVDSRYLAEAAKDHPDARTWTDFRKMLDQQKDIDAVMVSTPDHTHAVVSLTAMRLGKHVCTEKPLAHSVHEARVLAEAARTTKVATQLDNEGHSAETMRQLVETIRHGAIGEVREVHVWAHVTYHRGRRPLPEPCPAHLDWDLWLGPAPARDYHGGLHPMGWRGWWDFGTSVLGDFGCHYFDAAFWALELGQPTSVEAESEGNSRDGCPRWTRVRYQFPARGNRWPPVTVNWFDGGKFPPRPEELPRDFQWPSGGSIFIGSKGKVFVEGTSNFKLLPSGSAKGLTPPPRSLPRAPLNDHKLDWLRACRGGPPAGSNFAEYGGPLAEVVLLGNVAVRTGRRIEWDATNLRARNTPEADRYVRREYRQGWNL